MIACLTKILVPETTLICVWVLVTSFVSANYYLYFLQGLNKFNKSCKEFRQRVMTVDISKQYKQEKPQFKFLLGLAV